MAGTRMHDRTLGISIITTVPRNGHVLLDDSNLQSFHRYGRVLVTGLWILAASARGSGAALFSYKMRRAYSMSFDIHQLLLLVH